MELSELSVQVLEATLGLPAWLARTIAPAVKAGFSSRLRLRSGCGESLSGPLDFPAWLARTVAPAVKLGVRSRLSSRFCYSVDRGDSHGGCHDDCGNLHFGR